LRDLAYIIITPVRNEAEHVPKTIESVTSQTIRPVKWVIVNDGSTDGTGAILDAAAQRHPWINVVHRGDRGFRKSGGGVVEAFYDGYELARGIPWDFLVKLDGDLSFGPDYFASCFKQFRADTELGITGGAICAMIDGELVEESKGDPPFHVRGATKIYRRECWQAIGSLMKAPGWDTLDEIKANMTGWRTYTLHDLKLHQHRITGGADGSWKNWVKNGMANYVAGYHPAFMLAKCIKRALSGPSVTVPAGLAYGFLSGYLKRAPRTEPDVMGYVRQQQWKKLLHQPSLWG